MAPPAFWQELGVRLTRQAGRAFERGDAATAALYLGMAARLANRKAPRRGPRGLDREALLARLRPDLDAAWGESRPTKPAMAEAWGYSLEGFDTLLRRRDVCWSSEKAASWKRVATLHGFAGGGPFHHGRAGDPRDSPARAQEQPTPMPNHLDDPAGIFAAHMRDRRERGEDREAPTHFYREVSPDDAGETARGLARDLLTILAKDLNVPVPAVRWLQPTNAQFHANAKHWADERVHGLPRPADGFIDASVPGVIHLVVPTIATTQDYDAFAGLVAHEFKHYADARGKDAGHAHWREESVPIRELSARVYAAKVVAELKGQR